MEHTLQLQTLFIFVGNANHLSFQPPLPIGLLLSVADENLHQLEHAVLPAVESVVMLESLLAYLVNGQREIIQVAGTSHYAVCPFGQTLLELGHNPAKDVLFCLGSLSPRQKF